MYVCVSVLSVSESEHVYLCVYVCEPVFESECEC